MLASQLLSHRFRTKIVKKQLKVVYKVQWKVTRRRTILPCFTIAFRSANIDMLNSLEERRDSHTKAIDSAYVIRIDGCIHKHVGREEASSYQYSYRTQQRDQTIPKIAWEKKKRTRNE